MGGRIIERCGDMYIWFDSRRAEVCIYKSTYRLMIVDSPRSPKLE